MDFQLPPPGPDSSLDRLGAWARASKARQWMLLAVICVVSFVILFSAWIATAFFFQSSGKDSGAVALNLVVSCCVAIAGLIPMHRGVYRWYWHVERKRAAGKIAPEDEGPRYGSEPSAPPPRMDLPWAIRLRHALIYTIAIATLLYAFAPYEHQLAIIRFLGAHSAGRASAGSLAMLIFGYLPIGVLVALAMLLTHRQMRLQDAGQLDERGQLLLKAEQLWLFSFAAAFAVAVLLCRLAGGLIVQYL